MSAGQKTRALAEADIAGQITDMADQRGVPAPHLRWSAASHDGRYDERTTTIVIGRPLLASPGFAQEITAHEFGHYLYELSGAMPRHLRAKREAAILTPTLVFAAAMVLSAMSGPPTALIHPSTLVMLLVAVIGPAAAVMIPVATHIVGRRLEQDSERAADRLGAELGYPFRAEDLPSTSLIAGRRARLWAWFDGRHGTWPERLERIGGITPC